MTFSHLLCSWQQAQRRIEYTQTVWTRSLLIGAATQTAERSVSKLYLLNPPITFGLNMKILFCTQHSSSSEQHTLCKSWLVWKGDNSWCTPHSTTTTWTLHTFSRIIVIGLAVQCSTVNHCELIRKYNTFMKRWFNVYFKLHRIIVPTFCKVKAKVQTTFVYIFRGGPLLSDRPHNIYITTEY